MFSAVDDYRLDYVLPENLGPGSLGKPYREGLLDSDGLQYGGVNVSIPAVEYALKLLAYHILLDRIVFPQHTHRKFYKRMYIMTKFNSHFFGERVHRRSTLRSTFRIRKRYELLEIRGV